jgi:hypothetical protein
MNIEKQLSSKRPQPERPVKQSGDSKKKKSK